MVRIWPAAFLLFAVPASAQLRTATLEQKKQLLEIIANGIKAHEPWIKAREKERTLAKKVNQDNLRENLEAYEAAKLDREDLEKEMQAQFGQAIAKTQQYYNVHPEHGDGAVINGPLATKRVTWDPRFLPDEVDKRELDGPNKGEKHFAKFPVTGGQTGGTWVDGQVTIRLHAFQLAQECGNPGVLASTLFHEAVHFTDLISTGWGSREAVEANAYRRSFEEAGVFELSGSQVARLGWQVASYSTLAGLGLKVLPPLFPTSAQEAIARASLEQEDSDIRMADTQLAALAEIRSQEAALRERIEREAAERRADRERPPEHARVYYATELVPIIAKACREPGSLESLDLERVSWFPQPLYTGTLDWDRLSGCEAKLLREVIQLSERGGVLGVAWLRSMAMALQDVSGLERPAQIAPPGPPPWDDPGDFSRIWRVTAQGVCSGRRWPAGDIAWMAARWPRLRARGGDERLQQLRDAEPDACVRRVLDGIIAKGDQPFTLDDLNAWSAVPSVPLPADDAPRGKPCTPYGVWTKLCY